MANVNIAVLGRPGYAKEIGKMGTSSDITFYNLKRGENTVTFVEPTRYPDRLAPLFYAVSMADMALVVLDEITPIFGEIAVMLDVLGISKGYIMLGNYLDPVQIMPLVKGTVLEHYEYVEDNSVSLRERFLDDAAIAERGDGKNDCAVVTVDHHFHVKGIGTVILGGVERGIIRRHDTLTILPAEKTAQLRSIQRHDDDVEDAMAGDRVGLALKNIGHEELDRGYVLTNDKEVRVSTLIEGPAQLVRFWKEPIREDMVMHLGHWMQFVPARVESMNGETGDASLHLALRLDKEIVYLPGDRVVLHHLDAGKLRVAGTMVLN